MFGGVWTAPKKKYTLVGAVLLFAYGVVIFVSQKPGKFRFLNYISFSNMSNLYDLNFFQLYFSVNLLIFFLCA